MDSTIEDIVRSKELHEADREIPHIDDSVHTDIGDYERKRARYKESFKYIKSLSNRDPSTSTTRCILSTTVVEILPTLNPKIPTHEIFLDFIYIIIMLL